LPFGVGQPDVDGAGSGVAALSPRAAVRQSSDDAMLANGGPLQPPERAGGDGGSGGHQRRNSFAPALPCVLERDSGETGAAGADDGRWVDLSCLMASGRVYDRLCNP
jgi:hypothetical protein